MLQRDTLANWATYALQICSHYKQALLALTVAAGMAGTANSQSLDQRTSFKIAASETTVANEELEKNWPVHIIVLNRFLQKHRDKHILVYWDHDLPIQWGLLLDKSFWQMLSLNGFTHYFEELPRTSEHTYFVPMNGIIGMRVDRGYRGSSDASIYDAWMGNEWLKKKFEDGLEFNGNPELEITQMAVHTRYLLKRPENQHAREFAKNYKSFISARVDDSKTGKLSAELAEKIDGRIWQMWGKGHFTACGLHTYIPNALVITIHENELAMRRYKALKKYPDVIINPVPLDDVTPAYDFLIREGKISLRKEIKRPTSYALRRKAACLRIIEKARPK